MSDPMRPSESNEADSNRPVSRRTKANKASALRWAIGLVVVLVLGVAAWVVLGPERGQAPDLAPQHQPEQGSDQGNGINQPPAVIPNQDTGGAAPAANPPSDSGTGMQ